MLLTQEFEPYVRNICNKQGVPLLADKVIAHASSALRMHTVAPPTYSDFSMTSRFGGKPALPSNMPWPEGENGFQLDFILQINLSEIAFMPQAAPLPKNGMLSLFADRREQGDLESGRSHKVIYSSGELNLRDIPFSYEYDGEKIKENLIRFSEIMTIYDADRLQERCSVELNPKEIEVHEQYLDCATCDEAMHLLFGIQTHDDDSGPIDMETGDYIQFPDPLQLLFRIDWDEAANTNWFDGGRLYFYIRPENLARTNFSQVSCAVFAH